MPRHRESNAELLLKLPWRVSAGLGALAFGLLPWGLPVSAGQPFSPNTPHSHRAHGLLARTKEYPPLTA